MSERQKEGEKKLAAYGTLRQACSPLKRQAAEDGRNAPGHSNGATFSDSNEKKVQNQIASDKEGMSSRAIHRHSACGEVLK